MIYNLFIYKRLRIDFFAIRIPKYTLSTVMQWISRLMIPRANFMPVPVGHLLAGSCLAASARNSAISVSPKLRAQPSAVPLKRGSVMDRS